jgi:hypothetical protein
MGYHLTILRTVQGKQVPITLAETLAAASALGGWTYQDSPPTFELRSPHGTCPLWHQDGELWTKNSEAWALEPMLVLAKQLNARVRGDEFETYETVDNTYFHPDDRQLRSEAEAQSKGLIANSLREQRLIRNCIVGFFVVLGSVAYFVGKLFERA